MAPLLMILTACFVGAAIYYWEQLFVDDPQVWRTLRSWGLRGAAIPLVLWIFFNLGLSPRFPPLWPELQMLKAARGNCYVELLAVTVMAGCVIASFWAAATLGWMMATIALRTQRRGELIGFAVFWSVLLLPVAVPIIYYFGLPQLGVAISLWLVPIVHFTHTDARVRKIVPIYSRAIARLKFGKYSDAEAEVIRQLEQHEEDFDGWMMLADMYANHFNDLAHADQTIRDLCAQPKITSVQISIALHRLADWHLKLGNDPDAACAALAELCRKLPGTHFNRMAQLRIRQLPVTRKDLADQRDKKVRLRTGGTSLDATEQNPARSKLSETDALSVVNDHAEKLRQDPNNVPARERFATILAEDLGKVDLALEQLELLMGMPEQPERKIAEWLSLTAAWHLRYRNDQEAAAKLMERLVHEYPQTPQAFAAQRHLNLMELERRFKRASAARD